MKISLNILSVAGLLILILFLLNVETISACSTFKLQKGQELIYGHNLNQGDIGVPGMIFINKRGNFKTGRTWSELINKDRSNPSSFYWISRYGSVTFNVFGRDFPDGGMNEAGLYIWEMSEDADYPKETGLPKLNQMNWMQFILDSYSTVDEAVHCASEVEIEGWGWHYFVGDAQGNCAAIAFIDGKAVVNRDQTMPVPGLFNSPYKRELELLKYFRGFGGSYEPNLEAPQVPRFVKTAVMIRDYDPAKNGVDYGFKMLDTLKVNDVPEWTVIIDANRRHVFFKTRINPQIKHFSMNKLDFSNRSGILILDMDSANSGDVLDLFHPHTNMEIRNFLDKRVVPILPEKFFTSGGLTMDEFLDRFSTHGDHASLPSSQFFRGVWTGKIDNGNEIKAVTLNLNTHENRVSGSISISEGAAEVNEIEHLQLFGSRLKFTFRTKNKTIIEANATIEQNQMKLEMLGIEKSFGRFTLFKQD